MSNLIPPPQKQEELFAIDKQIEFEGIDSGFNQKLRQALDYNPKD